MGGLARVDWIQRETYSAWFSEAFLIRLTERIHYRKAVRRIPFPARAYLQRSHAAHAWGHLSRPSAYNLAHTKGLTLLRHPNRRC